MLSPRDPVIAQLRALGLSPSAARRLSQAGTPMDLPAGATLCTKGDLGQEAFLLLEGEATVDLGHQVIHVGPGAIIGETATLDPFARRNATVRAVGPIVALVYDVRTFRSLASTDLHELLVPDRAA
jgi:voltage-gated potassium channel